MISCLR